MTPMIPSASTSGTASSDRGTYPVCSAVPRSKRASWLTSATASGCPVEKTYPAIPSCAAMASPMTPWPCGPAAARNTRLPVACVVQRDRRGRHAQGRGAGVGDGVEGRLGVRGRQSLGGGQPSGDGHQGLEGVERSVVPLAPGLGHRRAAAASRRGSGMTRSSPSNRSRPWATKSASSRFTDWREPPIMPASSPWVYGHGKRCSPAPLAALVALDRAQQVTGEPAGQVEEMEILDLRGEAPDLAGQAGEQRAAQAGLRVDQSVEGVAAEHERLDRVHRDRRRRSWRPVEQRQLAEEPAPPDRGEDRRFGAVVRARA